jgi:PAS domain-containing protein
MPPAESPAAPQLAAFDLDAFHRRMNSSRHIELLLGQVPDVNYFAKDELGRFVQADPGFVAMLGATKAEDVLGRTDADFFPPEFTARFVADDQAVMKTGEPLCQQLEPVPRPDRTFEWRTVTKVPLRDLDGRVIDAQFEGYRILPPDEGSATLVAQVRGSYIFVDHFNAP